MTGGLSAAMVPLLAVFLLPVRDYGAFSLVYLVFAEAWSILLSAVCDTWARRRAAGESAGAWGDYAGALAPVCGLAAVVTFAVALPVLGSPLQAVAMAAAVATSLYRQGGRYHHVVARGPLSVVPADVVAVLMLAAVLGGLRAAGQPLLTALLVAWALSGAASAAWFVPGALGGAGPLRWYRRNGSTVRTLLGESLLMDAGATGTPVVVAPILGLHDFGIYRSVSSLSVPIQLLIDPMRPYLSQVPLRNLLRPRSVAALVGTAATLAVAGYLALAYVVPAVLGFSPVLGALSHLALPCSLFLGCQLLTYVLTIVARMHLRHRLLIVGRAVHTTFAVIVPVFGAVLGGATGAVWCFVATTALTVVIWATLLVGARRRHDDTGQRADSPEVALAGAATAPAAHP